MKFTKPKPKRVYAEFRDPDGKEDRVHLTIYECTPQEAADRLRSLEQKPVAAQRKAVAVGGN